MQVTKILFRNGNVASKLDKSIRNTTVICKSKLDLPNLLINIKSDFR